MEFFVNQNTQKIGMVVSSYRYKYLGKYLDTYHDKDDSIFHWRCETHGCKVIYYTDTWKLLSRKRGTMHDHPPPAPSADAQFLKPAALNNSSVTQLTEESSTSSKEGIYNVS